MSSSKISLRKKESSLTEKYPYFLNWLAIVTLFLTIFLLSVAWAIIEQTTITGGL